MHTPSLFNPLIRRINLLAAIEAAEGELTPELEEALNISDDDISARTEEMLALRSQAKVQIMGAEADVARSEDFIKRTKRTVELIEARLLEATKRVGPITAGTYRVSTTRSAGVIIAEGTKVPNEYGTLVPAVAEFYKPDKKLLKKALDAGTEIEGVTLEKRINLTVK